MPTRLLSAALIGLVMADPARANTGNFLPQLAAVFILVPALLLAPAIAIAAGRQQRVRKAPWIVAALALAAVSFGSLWWAIRALELMAGPGWPVIYVWVSPGILLWLAFRRQVKSG